MAATDSVEIRSHPHQPKFLSFADALVWKTHGAGILAGWVGGRIVSSWDRFSEDVPILDEEFPMSLLVRDWIEELDGNLPCREDLLPVLDENALVIRPDSPLFRIPNNPDPSDAAECAVAARVLAHVGDALVPPSFHDFQEVVGWLDRAAATALLAGGETANLIVARLVSRLCRPHLAAVQEED